LPAAVTWCVRNFVRFSFRFDISIVHGLGGYFFKALRLRLIGEGYLPFCSHVVSRRLRTTLRTWWETKVVLLLDL